MDPDPNPHPNPNPNPNPNPYPHPNPHPHPHPHPNPNQTRGGAVTKRAQHALICNSDARFAEEARLAARGAQTYREFGREASKRHERWMGAFGTRRADAKSELATARQAGLAF